MSHLKIIAFLLGGLGILICGAEIAVAQVLLVPSVDGSTASNGRVARYDGNTGEFLDLLFGPIDPQINSVALGPNGLLYVSTQSPQNTGNVLRFNVITGQFIDTFIASIDTALEMTFGPDDNLYVVKTGGNVFQIRRYDGTTGDFIDVFAAGLSLPQDLTFGPDGNLYVSNATGFISRFDGSTGAAIGGFSAVGLNGPHGLTFGPDGNLYVVGAFSDNVVRYNALTGAVIDEFVTEGLEVPTDLIFGPDGNLYINSTFPEILVPGGSAGGILRYDGQSGDFIDQFVTPGSGGLGLIKRGFLFVSIPEPSVTDTCDVGGGPNDIETVTASYDVGTDEIIVEMVLCADADDSAKYQVFFDHEDGVDVGPDTLEPNPDCVRTWDDRMTHKGRNDLGPGMIDVFGKILTFRVGVAELNPLLGPDDSVLIWADTKLKNVTDKAPNTESGDGCNKPEVASELLSVTLH